MSQEASFATLLTREGWFADVRPLEYLSHFVTPRTSPIRFAARFFLGTLPVGPRTPPVHRRSVGGVLDPSWPGVSSLRSRRDGHGGAGRVWSGLSGPVRVARRTTRRSRRQREIPRHRPPDRFVLGALRLEGQSLAVPVSRLARAAERCLPALLTLLLVALLTSITAVGILIALCSCWRVSLDSPTRLPGPTIAFPSPCHSWRLRSYRSFRHWSPIIARRRYSHLRHLLPGAALLHRGQRVPLGGADRARPLVVRGRPSWWFRSTRCCRRSSVRPASTCPAGVAWVLKLKFPACRQPERRAVSGQGIFQHLHDPRRKPAGRARTLFGRCGPRQRPLATRSSERLRPRRACPDLCAQCLDGIGSGSGRAGSAEPALDPAHPGWGGRDPCSGPALAACGARSSRCSIQRARA